jgi:hypothetical protein
MLTRVAINISIRHIQAPAERRASAGTFDGVYPGGYFMILMPKSESSAAPPPKSPSPTINVLWAVESSVSREKPIPPITTVPKPMETISTPIKPRMAYMAAPQIHAA